MSLTILDGSIGQELVRRQGDTPTGLYLVVHGQVKLVFTSPKGDEKIVELMGPGRTFGEALVFVTRPYPVRAQALTESLLLFVEKAALFDELQRDNNFGARIIAGLSRRIHGLMADLEAHSMHNGTQRFIGFLLRDHETNVTNGPVEIHLQVTKSAIASRLNLSQEHLSRILHDLSERQLIHVQGRDISVPDVERLRDFVA